MASGCEHYRVRFPGHDSAASKQDIARLQDIA
jgi:hypothetical protein